MTSKRKRHDPTQMVVAHGMTIKQYKILTVLCHGNGKNDDGEFIPCDIDELLDRLSYRTSKESMQFSIRALVRRNLLTKEKETRRGSSRVVLTPSPSAFHIMGYRDTSFMQTMDSSYLDILNLDI